MSYIQLFCNVNCQFDNENPFHRILLIQALIPFSLNLLMLFPYIKIFADDITFLFRRTSFHMERFRKFS